MTTYYLRGCLRCPNQPFGCWPNCLFLSATWTSNNTSDPPPKWVKEWDAEMDRRALAAQNLKGKPCP